MLFIERRKIMDFMNEARRVAWNAKAKVNKRESVKQTIKAKVKACQEFVCENAETIAALSPMIIYGGRSITGMLRNAHRSMNLRKEQDLKDLYCYDRSLGHYWALRRKLTNREWTEIDKRKRAGEKLGEILNQMKVLK